MNIIESFRELQVIQIGCGGTGSWVVPLVSKLLGNIKNRIGDQLHINYTLIDDDSVEERNILRQNFNEWDIGNSKTRALANRYVYNFEKIVCKPIRIKSDLSFRKVIFDKVPAMDKILILIGCVDNNKTRQIINRTLSESKEYHGKIIYIDSGNELYNGQVLTLSFRFEEYLIEALSTYHEDKAETLKKQIQNRRKLNFNKMFPKNKNKENQQSCAFFGDQSQAINNLAASIIFCNLQKILISSEMPPQLITFNSSGYSTFEL